MLYGTLLGLSEAECEQMASGGSQEQRRRCMRDLRRRYRRENAVPEQKRRSGPEELEFWRSKAEIPRFVYFIQQGATGPVKIGIAKDPLDRMGTLQTGNPAPLNLRHVVPGERDL